jgi:hypothetical protein
MYKLNDGENDKYISKWYSIFGITTKSWMSERKFLSFYIEATYLINQIRL